MATTTEELIFYPDDDSVDGYQTDMATLASSVNTRLSTTRALKVFKWANDSARNAQTGMVVGDEGYQADGWTWKYFSPASGAGLGWYRWALSPTGYTPTIAGATVVPPSFYYNVSSGMVSIAGRIPITAGSGDVTFTTPPNCPIPTTGSDDLGTAILIDLGTANYRGVLQRASSTTVYVRVINSAGTYAAVVGMSATIPFTWTAGDTAEINCSYPLNT